MVQALRRPPATLSQAEAKRAEVIPLHPLATDAGRAAFMAGSLPPQVPHKLEELDLAAQLLGNYIGAQGALKQSRLEQLKQLLGALPSMHDAPRWKTGLKKVRAELVERARG
jgi:hypothetical protein